MTYTVNCSILLTELPLPERPAGVKAAGFDAGFDAGERLGCRAFHALYGNRVEGESPEKHDAVGAADLATAAAAVSQEDVRA